MAVKTITVTEEAYNALKSMKGPSESFRETIVRVTGKRSLSQFIGILSEASASKMTKAVREARARRREVVRSRKVRVAEALGGA
jgi:predicted CopG family antitoxin